MVHTTYDASSSQSKRLRKAAGRYLAGLRKDAADAEGLSGPRRPRLLHVYPQPEWDRYLQIYTLRLPMRSASTVESLVGDGRFYDPWTYEILFGSLRDEV